MSIHSIFETPNTPLNELINAIKFTHPNIKSMRIRLLNPDSKQVVASGLDFSHLEKEFLYFVMEREVVLPISATLMKRVIGHDHSVVKLMTYVKVVASKDVDTPGSRIERIDMITSVPSCFNAYAKGHEIVSILPTSAGDGCVVSLTLNYTLQAPEEEGLLKSFGFSINTVVRKFIEMVRTTLVTEYSEKRQLQFGEPYSSNVVTLEGLREALRRYA